jgi:hypothetical protein
MPSIAVKLLACFLCIQYVLHSDIDLGIRCIELGAQPPTCQKYAICKTLDHTQPRQGIHGSTYEGSPLIISDEN